MKKIILFLIFASNLYFCQEEDKDIYAKAGLPTPIDLPNDINLNVYTDDIERQVKGYSNDMPSNPNIPSLSIKEEPISRTREYVNNLRRNTQSSLSNNSLGQNNTLAEISRNSNRKINISGGWAKKSDVNSSESDAENQSSSEVNISDGYNSNSSITLIFMIFLILNILLCYFIALKLGKTRKIGFWWCFIAGICLSPFGGVLVALLTPSLKSNDINNRLSISKSNDYRKIIVTGGGQSEMRKFIRSLFKKLEDEIRKEDSYLSNEQMRKRIIEMIYNISQDLLYPDISKFQIKYTISSSSEVRQIIDEEIARAIVMLS